MATYLAKTEISDTGSNPTNAVARTGFGRLWDWVNEVLGMWIVAGGSADAISASYTNNTITSLVDGHVCRVRAIAANTTTTPNFSPNGLIPRTITMAGGNALAAGSIAGAGHELILKYNSAGPRWELLNPAVTATTLNAVVKSGSSLTGALNDARGAVTMATTGMNLWAQPFVIDGSGSAANPITSIVNAPQAGASRLLYPIAASVLQNGAMFAIDGGVDATAIAGDGWLFEAITVSTYKVHVIKNAVAVGKNLTQSWSAPQRGDVTNNTTSLSFNLNTSNNFKCSVSTSSAITFTNIPTGQTGAILFVQTGSSAPTAAGTTHITTTDLNTLGVAGTYLISYAAMDGTNVECVVSRKLA